MREIKFRAWDKINEKMVTSLNEDANYCIAFNGELHAIAYGTTPFNVTLPNGGEEGERFILMQYTGLKDKNGTPIFEGDILGWSHPELEEPDRYEVVYEAPSFMAKHLEHPEYVGGTKPLTDPEQFEVIGNIYENPELITPNSGELE